MLRKICWVWVFLISFMKHFYNYNIFTMWKFGVVYIWELFKRKFNLEFGIFVIVFLKNIKKKNKRKFWFGVLNFCYSFFKNIKKFGLLLVLWNFRLSLHFKKDRTQGMTLFFFLNIILSLGILGINCNFHFQDIL